MISLFVQRGARARLCAEKTSSLQAVCSGGSSITIKKQHWSIIIKRFCKNLLLHGVLRSYPRLGILPLPSFVHPILRSIVRTKTAASTSTAAASFMYPSFIRHSDGNSDRDLGKINPSSTKQLTLIFDCRQRAQPLYNLPFPSSFLIV